MPSDRGRQGESRSGLSRRAFLEKSAAAGVGASTLGGRSIEAAGLGAQETSTSGPTGSRRPRLLYPQQNQHRNLVDLSGR
jgi:hypothetical protein